MKNKNTRKRLLCLLLALCSILANINFNRLEPRAEVDEKKLYMDHMAKVAKKWKKRMKQEFKDDPYASGNGYVFYRMIDLDGDGRKELVYGLQTPETYCYEQLFICTIKKGKVHKVWKSSTAHGVSLCRVKGEKKKWVVDYYSTGGINAYDIYIFSSGKMKKVSEYYYNPGALDDYCYYNNNMEKIKEPPELRSSNLKYINFKEYK